MKEKIPNETQDLLKFLDDSPTAWHLVANASERLDREGFIELKEGASWEIKPGGHYFVTRNGSSICAFVVPSKTVKEVRIVASHTDSPALKLKPNPEYHKKNMIMMGLEVYGGPLLSSWLNRDLGIAGRISYLDEKGKAAISLVKIDEHPLTIPQLAIHLDKEVNEKGLIINKQDHLPALAALKESADEKIEYLETLLKKKIKFKHLLGHDLFLYPLDPPRLIGQKKEMIAAYRIDSLLSVHAALHAFIKSHKPETHILKMAIFWDNEEIGSNTSQGAGSPFFSQILERISLALKQSREDYLRLIENSLCVSVDLGHALHPNYMDKHDPQHQSLLNQGVMLKMNAQRRYITDAETGAFIASICHKHKIPMQRFVARSDLSSGSTIGPIHAGLTGMKTVDIGCPQLSMHSIRELAATQDHLDLCKLLEFCLNEN